MLKFEMRTGNLGSDASKLDLFSVSKHDYYADSDKVEVRNIHMNGIALYKGAEVTVISTIDREDEFGELYPVSVTDSFRIVELDNSQNKFTFIADKYQNLPLTGLGIEVEDTVLYLHFTFDEWHYFRSWESYGIFFIVEYPSGNGNLSSITFDRCQYVSDTELKWRYDAGKEGIEDFMCSIFKNDEYNAVGYAEDGDEILEKYVEVETIPETACFTDEMYLRVHVTYSKGDYREIFVLDNGEEIPVVTEDLRQVYVLISGGPNCSKWILYDKQCNDGTLLGVSSKRLNFKFNDINSTEEYIIKVRNSVQIPLSTESAYDLYQETNINKKFVKAQTEASKNSSPEMEKYVYSPVYAVRKGDVVLYKPVRKIKFNLHFRQRSKDGWLVNPEGYWNGMDAVTGLHGNVGGGGYQFFSYKGNGLDNQGKQSDLLCYLGFTDNDIKYQKYKLKKSFLRLSFYDSMNRANQNLLCYSTIFIDSGKLFAKKMRGANRTEEVNGLEMGIYVKSDQAGNEVRYSDVKVDTEPCLDERYYDLEDVEQYRLSSQICVGDRASEGCSEGFYLYLWSDNDNGVIPSDVYMRAEFNHAGYGRVIPLTMPYLDGDRIYSYEDIASIWLTGDNRGWGVLSNERFSYVHFKYAYDTETNRHVYFLDEDTYGSIEYVDSTPDEMEINLYEAKIRS